MRKFYIILVFISLSVSVTANTINVGGKSPVKSIKKAISLALSGDTILVAPGYYKEGNMYEKTLSQISYYENIAVQRNKSWTN